MAERRWDAACRSLPDGQELPCFFPVLVDNSEFIREFISEFFVEICEQRIISRRLFLFN